MPKRDPAGKSSAEAAPRVEVPRVGGPRLLSIGYEKAGFADFIATLQGAGVLTLIDVRDLPLSRRAGFSKRQPR